MSAGFPLNVMIIALILIGGFILYQYGEHIFTSGITKYLIMVILIVVIVIGLVSFML